MEINMANKDQSKKTPKMNKPKLTAKEKKEKKDKKKKNTQAGG
jgi:hypothetical protein